MIPYAPAWLRRWRKPLVPFLAAAGILSFAALLWLPPLAQALPAHAAWAAVGALAWPLLMILLNGDPLPRREAFVTATLDPDEVVAFVVRHDEATAMRAREEFWLRSVAELRLGSTIVPPVAIAFFAVLTYKMAPDAGVAAFFAGFAVLAAVFPVISFFVNRRAGALHARRFPELHVSVTREGIAVGKTAGETALAWSNVARLWESESNLTLVLNPYMALQLPRADVPDAARRIMRESVAYRG